ncbi:hypothetical protein N9414_15105 [Nodularia spumigena CCY9414]|jgi:hypothetical protein|nr:hypothetical protein N9414_15105 [Nodularia spumigena CCY9414]
MIILLLKIGEWGVVSGEWGVVRDLLKISYPNKRTTPGTEDTEL